MSKTVVRPDVIEQRSGGAIVFNDADTGLTRATIGVQDDGTVAVVAQNGPPPPAPHPPVVVAAQLSVVVTWDGQLTEATPADFDHVQIHVSDTAGFTPDATTLAGSLRTTGMFPIAPLEAAVPVWVVLVAVNTSGAAGAPSTAATATPTAVIAVIEPDSITETDIQDDSISTPKLQANAVTADKIGANEVTAGKLEAVLALVTILRAGLEDGSHVDMTATGIYAYNADGVQTAAFTGDVGAFTGDTVLANRLTAAVAQINAGTQGGLFVYGADPTVSGPLNPDPLFADPEVTNWVADGATPSTLFYDTANPYNGAAASLKVVYEETDGTLLVGQVTSTPHIGVVAGSRYSVTLVALVQAECNVSIVLDYFNASGTRIHTDQSSYITDAGVWQTVTLASTAPTGAVTCSIKAFGRAPADAPLVQVNLGYFALVAQSAPITITAAPGTDQYGNTYPAGIGAPAATLDSLTVNGYSELNAINGTTVALTGPGSGYLLYGVGATPLNANPNPTDSHSTANWSAGPNTKAVNLSTTNWLRVEWDGTSLTTAQTPSMSSEIVSVVAGKSYEIQAFLNPNTNGMGGYVALVWSNSAGTVLSRTVGATIPWPGNQLASVSGVAPATATGCRVRVSWSATPKAVNNPANAVLSVQYARLLLTNALTAITSTGGQDQDGVEFPPGVVSPYGVTAPNVVKGYKFGTSVSYCSSSGLITVTHLAGFEPDMIDLIVTGTSPSVMTGTNHWTGHQLSGKDGSTFTVAMLGGNDGARIYRPNGTAGVGVEFTFNWVCWKFT